MTKVNINIKNDILDVNNLENGYYMAKCGVTGERLVLYNSILRFDINSTEKVVIYLDSGCAWYLSDVEIIRRVNNLEINVE